MAVTTNGLTFGSYTDGMRVPAPYAKPLARSLANALPSDADDDEKAALRAIGERADAIEETLNERDDVASLRDPYLTHANSWGALFDALAAKARIPAKHSDVSERAKAVLDKIGDGRDVFTRDAPSAWSEGDRRYKRIGELGLEGEINSLVGPEHLAAVKQSIVDLGEAIGTGETRRELPSSTGLAEGLYALSKAVAKYCRVLAAKVDDDDPESIERFRKAVAPIDEYRSRSPRSDGTTEDLEATDQATSSTQPTQVEPAPSPLQPVVAPSDDEPSTN